MSLSRYMPCGHLSIANDTARGKCCALCSAVFTTNIILRLSGHNPTFSIRYDDAHPYYGPDTIMRIVCHRSTFKESVPGTGRVCRRSASCSQEFFATMREFIAWNKSSCDQLDPNADPHCAVLTSCHEGHMIHSTQYALYIVMTALELATTDRFDYPIHIPGGMRAGYNPDPRYGFIILCNDINIVRVQENRIRAQFKDTIVPRIVRIDPIEILRRCHNSEISRIGSTFFSSVAQNIARYVLSCAHIDYDIAINIDPVRKLHAQRICESGRILTEFAHHESQYTSRDICNYTIRTGRWPPIVEDDQYDTYPRQDCALDRAGIVSAAQEELRIETAKKEEARKKQRIARIAGTARKAIRELRATVGTDKVLRDIISESRADTTCPMYVDQSPRDYDLCEVDQSPRDCDIRDVDQSQFNQSLYQDVAPQPY